MAVIRQPMITDGPGEAATVKGKADAAGQPPPLAAANRAVRPSSLWGVKLTLPAPEHLAFYAGVGAMAVFGIMEWPVVAALVIGHSLVNAQHNKVLQSLGEALEEA
jgi:hypothetical protein